MRLSVEVFSATRGWVVRVIDDNGQNDVVFVLQQSAKAFADGHRLRLGIPPAEDISPAAPLKHILEVESRLKLSRQNLDRYLFMLEAGSIPYGDRKHIDEELAVLSGLASAHPATREQIVDLVVGWSKVQRFISDALH